jgi:hypothetical protein
MFHLYSCIGEDDDAEMARIYLLFLESSSHS